MGGSSRHLIGNPPAREGKEMTVMSRREYLRAIYARYQRSQAEQKGAILSSSRFR